MGITPWRKSCKPLLDVEYTTVERIPQNDVREQNNTFSNWQNRPHNSMKFLSSVDCHSSFQTDSDEFQTDTDETEGFK